jgi:benzodiazapine receptor
MSLSIAPTPLQRSSAWRAGVVLVPLLLVLGGLSARFSGSTEDNAWYQTLTLPALQPPGPVFGIAWSILYTLIAVSAAIVWGHKRAPGRTLALVLFGIGVAVNLAWSPTFFRFHLITPALGIIAVMLIVALATTFAFGRVSRLAAWLMVPYLVWLCFAGALNASVIMLNPAADAFQLGI